ncbi:MAG: transcriptional regulator [Rhodobacteraceae bacterium HLUCCA12]|nr:MAG: transcriptional regulator [Rhodobacteraceae bacterium HLUCCA12]
MSDHPLREFDLHTFLPYRLVAAANRTSRAFAERYRSEFGISIAEWRVLAHLNHAGAVSVRDIEARVDMEKSKVSRAASRLQDAGYITKHVNGGDRRLLELRLTPSGQALVARLLPVAVAYQQEMLERLGDAAPGLIKALDILLRDLPPGNGET